MACCCGGPLVGGSGFATTVKYAPTGYVMWWVDSGKTNNAGVYHDGVYYELSAPTSGGNTILRSIDSTTGAELNRRDIGSLWFPEVVFQKNGDILAYMTTSSTRVDKINTADLSSIWTHSSATSALTVGVRNLIEGDFVILPYKVAGVDTWKAHQDGTTLLWSLGMTNVGSWHCIDSNGHFVGGGSSGGSVRVFRYNTAGSLVDSYACAAGTSSVAGVAADGTNLWVRLTTATNDRAVLLNNSLAEVFAPVVMSTVTSGKTFIAPVSGAAYYCTQRFVTRVTSGGTVSTRHDHGATPEVHGFSLLADQDAFALKDGTTPWRLLGYDDSAAPATTLWTMNPTLANTGVTQRVADARFHVSHDEDGNIYVTGVRLADTSLDKVP